MTKPDVHAGDVWRDRDRRMMSGNRRVKVTRTALIDGTAYVFYRSVVGANNREIGTEFRSRYERFQRAFDKAEA